MVALASSTTEFLLILLAVWLAIGVTLAVVMGRRGHGAFQWLLIGAFLGPLSLPIAWVSIRDEDRGSGSARALHEGIAGVGPVNVLVGIDGSVEAANALRTVVDLVGTNIGRLTLASVVTFDVGSVQARREEERAIEVLDAAASSVEAETPSRVLLTGQPAEVLMRHAAEEGYDLLAIGRRGRGATKAVLGSTASRVADGPLPALIV
jgi:nucleotide-binding universal stress UspA family protein